MNYEEFRDKLAEDLQEALYERGFEDVSIKFNDTTKANVSYEAMTVTPLAATLESVLTQKLSSKSTTREWISQKCSAE